LAKQGGVAPAALSDTLAARIATYTNLLAGLEQSTTPVTNILLVFISAQVGGDGFVYSRAKADIVVATMNKAYARAGFTFLLARELTASFTTVQGITCDGFEADMSKCHVCTWYTNDLPANLRKRGVQVLYFFKWSADVKYLAASYLLETLYGDVAGSGPTCLDGTHINSNPDVDTGGTLSVEEAALVDAKTMVDEVSAF
jgi:hypothetical protein